MKKYVKWRKSNVFIFFLFFIYCAFVTMGQDLKEIEYISDDGIDQFETVYATNFGKMVPIYHKEVSGDMAEERSDSGRLGDHDDDDDAVEDLDVDDDFYMAEIHSRYKLAKTNNNDSQVLDDAQDIPTSTRTPLPWLLGYKKIESSANNGATRLVTTISPFGTTTTTTVIIVNIGIVRFAISLWIFFVI